MALLRHDVGRGALCWSGWARRSTNWGSRSPSATRSCGHGAAGLASGARAGAGLRTGEEKARWLATWIATTWEELDRPCSAAAVDDALACAERRARAHDPARAVLVHGDVHQWNTLAAGEGFKLVDPDGLEAEPEYDLGIIMREDPLELLDGDPMERAERLATGTASTRRRSGSGASSSGSRPGCWGSRWACSRWRPRCCARRTGWQR